MRCPINYLHMVWGDIVLLSPASGPLNMLYCAWNATPSGITACPFSHLLCLHPCLFPLQPFSELTIYIWLLYCKLLSVRPTRARIDLNLLRRKRFWHTVTIFRIKQYCFFLDSVFLYLQVLEHFFCLFIEEDVVAKEMVLSYPVAESVIWWSLLGKQSDSS